MKANSGLSAYVAVMPLFVASKYHKSSKITHT